MEDIRREFSFMSSFRITCKADLESAWITTAPFPLLRECSRAFKMSMSSVCRVEQVFDSLQDPVKWVENTPAPVVGMLLSTDPTNINVKGVIKIPNSSHLLKIIFGDTVTADRVVEEGLRIHYQLLFFLSSSFYEWEHRMGTMCPFSSLHPLRKGKEM